MSKVSIGKLLISGPLPATRSCVLRVEDYVIAQVPEVIGDVIKAEFERVKRALDLAQKLLDSGDGERLTTPLEVPLNALLLEIRLSQEVK